VFGLAPHAMSATAAARDSDDRYCILLLDY